MNAPMTPRAMVDAAAALAWQLIQMPSTQLVSEMRRLRAEEPVLHALVREHVRQMSSRWE